MSLNARSALLALLVPLAFGGLGAAPATAAVPVPDSITADNVPTIDPEVAKALEPYGNVRSASFADWHPTERRMIVSTRFGDTRQIHEVSAPGGARRQLTFYPEPVGFGTYRPGKPDQILFSRDEGGNETFQIFLLDRATNTTRRLSDGVHRHLGGSWSEDGKQIAYVSNARNLRDMDLYVQDVDSGESRLVAEVQGLWFPLDWSPDNKRLLVGNYISVTRSSIHLLDLETGEMRQLGPPEGEEASYSGAIWSADGTAVFSVNDRNSEFKRLVRIDPATGAETVLTRNIPWDVEGYSLSDDGELLAFEVNEDGLSKIRILDLTTGKELPGPELPPAVIFGFSFRDGSRELGLTLSWARSSSDVYSFDVTTRKLERWTESELAGLNPDLFPIPELVRYPTFDEVADASGQTSRRTIPALVYRPDDKRHPGPRPVYIDIHGGPEGQSRPTFQGTDNYFVNELGITLIVPNVRGSTGYGKTYVGLDNGMLREDSVKDIGALLDWIATQDDLDASRVMVGGGSYGGYMVLASLVHYSDRLRAGFDAVGISNFVTFLTNTQAYRRDLRRVEYGDERDPEMRAFLEKISPANQVERIRRPLLVAQGANDPRVPLSESDQIVAALKGQGTLVWYVVAADEGHGFRKKGNADYLRAVRVEFMRRHLLGTPANDAAP